MPLESKTIVITGASDGIGAEAAAVLADSGYRVVLVGRSPAKLRAVAERIGTADVHAADFAELGQVRRLADELRERYERIDVLANNAGGLFRGPTATADGFEKTLQVNHLAPFLLTNLLVDRLIECRALVVNTSSVGARLYGRIDLEDLNNWRRFRPNKAYGDAKLANALVASALEERYGHLGLTALAFHPGIVATSFASDTSSYLRWVYRTALSRFLVSAEQGGGVLARFLDPENRDHWVSGGFYNEHGTPARTGRQAYDPDFVRRFWDVSSSLLGITWPDQG